MEIKVLYEDNHLIAVYKPAGVLVMAGDEKVHDDDTLYWQVKQFIKARDKKPGDVFLGVLHRLDRPVSGIVLFAKTSKGAARLSEQIRNRTVEKIYTAVVIGHLRPSAGTLHHHLRKDTHQRKATVADMGDESILHYQTLQGAAKFSLLKINLETGRFHQIRAQLAATGHPIVGDVKYGAPSAADGALCLSATELSFTMATTDEPIHISISYPSEWKHYLA